jgi:hypothetical protein
MRHGILHECVAVVLFYGSLYVFCLLVALTGIQSVGLIVFTAVVQLSFYYSEECKRRYENYLADESIEYGM